MPNLEQRSGASTEPSLGRDSFFRSVIRELTTTITDLIGFNEAAGFVSIVGQRVGEEIDRDYRRSHGVPQLDRSQVESTLVDLKHRIGASFEIVESDAQRIVLTNTACPFREDIEGRPALCMMTSNVFGTVTADNLGYARVEIPRSIAEGHGHCRVIVNLKRGSGEGREYFAADPADHE